MNSHFSPYSKEMQLQGHQKDKDAPPYKMRKGNRKKRQSKKVDYKGVPIPSRGKRSEFTDKHRKQIIEYFGGDWSCAECGYHAVSFHHIQFRTAANGLGRNNPRNGVPLCDRCHRRCHVEDGHMEYAQMWRDRQIAIWGPDYYKDAIDLWKEGKIERPTEELMDRYFEKERARIDQTRC
ncbi:hypothetical protein [Pseudobacillus badius]|uniref:hypothetical protein n=1 Tax=Bacillus badius TaxID=1455 RepID=UPI001CBDFF3E|nr:hypothetical protein [Bacillus badius]UAT29446.1 hypothetical protein K7T73_12635 [Bacillus badius]GLY11380.1 hypothetical protein Bbad01_25960 [Bacillus badius]